MNKRPSVAGNFDGHGGAPMQYRAHHQMQHDQGFTGSYRTPPSGDYLLRIAPAAARVTINAMKMQYVPTLLAVLMAIAMRRYYTACIAQWRRFVAFIKATKCRLWGSTRSDRGGVHGGWLCGLWPLTFLFHVLWSKRGAAIKCTQAQPGHIEDRRKALLNARTSVEPYQGLDVADQEKQDGEPPMRT